MGTQFGNIDPDMLSQISSDLRRCAVQWRATAAVAANAPLLGQDQNVPGGTEHSSAELMCILGNHIDRLRHWAKALSNPRSQALAFGDKPSRFKCRYSSELLLHCVVVAFSSRGTDYMQTVRNVLRIALPLQLQPLADTIAQGLPKKSTVKRARLWLDYALTIRQQMQNEQMRDVRRLAVLSSVHKRTETPQCSLECCA